LHKGCFSISELSKEFGISSRTIRYYEEKNLFSPLRTKGYQRIYSKKDRVRLKLILRGKKFGLKLYQIKEILGLYNVDLNKVEQMEKALQYGCLHLEQLKKRISELKSLEKELIGYGKEISKELKIKSNHYPEANKLIKQFISISKR